MNRINPEFLFSQLGYERRRNTSVEVAKAVGFVAVGALAGAALVALLTPKSGQQLRGDISKTAGQLKERAIEKGEELRSSMKEARENARSVVNNA